MNKITWSVLESKLDTSVIADWLEIPSDKKPLLIEFYNVSAAYLDEDDLQILADLFNGVTGSISWVECDECGDVHCMAYPDNWGDFQGVCCSSESSYLDECCLKTLLESL